MLTMSDLRVGTVVTLNGQPYVITFTQHIKVARSGATLRTKLKNLIDGATLEKSFSGGDKIEDADITRSRANFLYKDAERYYFMDNESFEQYEFTAEELGDRTLYLTDGCTVDALLYNGRAVSIELPKKIILKVESAPPGVRGDTSGSATKVAILETGLEVRVPLFIDSGEKIRINTETGEYVERAS